MIQTAEASRQLDWLVNDFARRVSGVTHALVVSVDGLKLAVSERVEEGVADQLAAVASGLVSLTRGAAQCFGAEPVIQTIVEAAGGYLFVTSVSEGSTLAVFAGPECDIGLIGYEMTLLVSRVGQLLVPAARGSGRSGGAGHAMIGDEQHGGRVVPAYALTRGRTQSVGRELPLETLVTATEFGLQWLGSLQMERREIVQRSTRPTSVAELAAHLRIPLGTARVLVGDLASSGHLTIHRPHRTADARPDRVILERLLDGLRAR